MKNEKFKGGDRVEVSPSVLKKHLERDVPYQLPLFTIKKVVFENRKFLGYYLNEFPDILFKDNLFTQNELIKYNPKIVDPTLRRLTNELFKRRHLNNISDERDYKLNLKVKNKK